MAIGRPSGLDEEDTREQLAKLISRGLSASEIGEVLGRHKDTILTWKRDEEVQQKVAALRRERANRLVSKIDAELEKRLEEIGELDVDQIMKIRRALVGGSTTRPGTSPEAAREAWRRQDEKTTAPPTEPPPERVPIPEK